MIRFRPSQLPERRVAEAPLTTSPTDEEFDAALERLAGGLLPGERPENLAWERDLEVVRDYCEANGLDFKLIHRKVAGTRR